MSIFNVGADRQGLGSQTSKLAWLCLFLAFIAAVVLRLMVLKAGAPFITIDDKTAFEGGFLVWFGNAPPQRMYIESWIYGIVSLLVYAVKSLSGLVSTGITLDIVADAYRDYYNSPAVYAWSYRGFILLLDCVTAFIVYRIAVIVLANRWRGWAAVAVAAAYLLSYNIIWSGTVARPDSVLSFFCALGFLWYLKSHWGQRLEWLLASAVLLGFAAGMKLHGAFLAIFVCIDLLRYHGLRAGIRKAIPLALISLFFFCWAAGSPFFDPLMYLKLRFANYVDDFSPWLRWSDHVWVIFRGMGWIVLPLMALGSWYALRKRDTDASEDATQRIKTIAVVAIGWLLLFASIRQLRAYWMLPALPLFYLMAIYGLTRLRQTAVAASLTGVMVAILLAQCLHEVRDINQAQYRNLRDWVTANVHDEPFYIFGYDALILPKNTQCIEKTARSLQQRIDLDRADGLRFTSRHVKNWEERSHLMLYDLLDQRNQPGYEFYDSYTTPPAVLAGIVDLGQMGYLIVQDMYDLSEEPYARELLEKRFEFVTEIYGAGGSGVGLKYRIYKRR